MKVIGTTDSATYICEVGHTELEKSANLYYAKLKSLKVGDSMNLGQGYDFTEKIKSACAEMTNAMKAFESARATMLQFANMVVGLEDGE